MDLSRRDYRKILECIDIIYSVRDTGAMFHALCDKLRKFIGIYSAIFVSANARTGDQLFNGYEIFDNSEGTLLAYLAHYAPQDPFFSRGWFKSHANEAARNTDLLPDLIRSEFACDFLLPMASVFYVIASRLSAQGDTVGILGIHRQRHDGNFSARDQKIVNILLPHIARSIHSQALLRAAEARKETCGVIMVNEKNDPIFMNDEARRALKRVPLRAVPDPGLGPGPAFFRNGPRTYRVRTVPFGGKTWGKFILLEPYPAGHRLGPSLDDFGLTRRENEVAVLVMQGHSNREIAGQLSICELTVKDHLKHIFGKLEIRRRGELAAMVLKSKKDDPGENLGVKRKKP